MKTYLDLLDHVLHHGTRKEDRTGTGTLSVFGWQMRFPLERGFPLLTTKKLHTRSIIHELLWFLQGDTNIGYLRDNGVTASMLTGDNSRTAAALAKLAGIGDVHADLRPEDKARIVAGFSETSPTAMIGDGINDAPALAGATVGIAMGATGSDAAIESADVAFTGHDLGLIPQALRHARRGGRIINQNIVLSLAIITVLLPLAITGVLGLAAVVLVHEVAEVVVIDNGLRAARARKQ